MLLHDVLYWHIAMVLFVALDCVLQKARIDLERFDKAYREWSYMGYELDRLVGIDRTMCEACGPSPRAVHVDGNFKLYRYRSAGRADASSVYHNGTIIEDRAAVDAHVRKVDSVTKVTNWIYLLAAK